MTSTAWRSWRVSRSSSSASSKRTPRPARPRWRSGGGGPGTSQPSLGDIRDAYESALQASKDVLVITVDATRSGTHATMATAAHSMPGRFAVVDSHTVSGAMGLIVMSCARARRKGASLEEAEALARRLAERIRLLAYIDTLDYLKRSGRVPAVRLLLGSLLQIKPIIRFPGGEPAM